jgi:hypothetical protein
LREGQGEGYPPRETNSGILNHSLHIEPFIKG